MRQAGATLHRGARASHYRGLSRCRAQAPDAQAQLLWLTGPVAHAACGILPDQGSNPCPLHWQADSQPLRHQGSPLIAPLHQAVLGIQRWSCPPGVNIPAVAQGPIRSARQLRFLVYKPWEQTRFTSSKGQFIGRLVARGEEKGGTAGCLMPESSPPSPFSCVTEP